MSSEFILTEENYYNKDRPHISVSRLKTYMQSPELYKRRHIDHDEDVQIEKTPSMKIGSMVDELLTQGSTNYQSKVKKCDDEELFELQKDLDEDCLLSESQAFQAVQIATDVKKHPLWLANISKADFQVLLKDDRALICGLADRIDKLPNNKYRLIDLKVTAAGKIESAKHWLWNCEKMKYANQLAMYQHLFCLNYGVNTKDVECVHVAASFISKGHTKIVGFKFPQSMLNEAQAENWQVYEQIQKQNFTSKKMNWEDVPTLQHRTFDNEEVA